MVSGLVTFIDGTVAQGARNLSKGPFIYQAGMVLLSLLMKAISRPLIFCAVFSAHLNAQIALIRF
jgi:hypothetical protein